MQRAARFCVCVNEGSGTQNEEAAGSAAPTTLLVNIPSNEQNGVDHITASRSTSTSVVVNASLWDRRGRRSVMPLITAETPLHTTVLSLLQNTRQFSQLQDKSRKQSNEWHAAAGLKISARGRSCRLPAAL
ncbi:hypothetical protein TRVL_07208 [Trypanosoma vivax]|nr:hypothetical protein TRVL_07208 [Trypanosoma vivax]